jgi:hypothetical protein
MQLMDKIMPNSLESIQKWQTEDNESNLTKNIHLCKYCNLFSQIGFLYSSQENNIELYFR